MNSAKVVVHVMDRDGMSVILNFLRESICQASETSHAHSHRQVLSFDI